MKKIVAYGIWNLFCMVLLSIQVWKHAHWSVALFVTGAGLRFTLEDALSGLKKLQREEEDKLVNAGLEKLEQLLKK